MLLAICATLAGLGAGWLGWWWAHRLLGSPEGLPPAPPACLACGLAWGAASGLLGAGDRLVELLALSVPLAALSLTDLAVCVIPNECVAAVLAVHLARMGALVARGAVAPGAALGQVLVGGIAALVPLLALTLLMDRVLGTESMGGGDLKLLAAAGACVGWRLLAPLLFVACLLGLGTAVPPVGNRARRGEPFPFGPSIACAFWLTLLVAPWADAWLAAWVF